MESSHDPRLLIAMGTGAEVTKFAVRWPSGAVNTREHFNVDQTYTIIEPEGPLGAGPISGQRSTCVY